MLYHKNNQYKKDKEVDCMEILIFKFIGDTDGPFTTRSRFPNCYYDIGDSYLFVSFFYHSYIRNSISPIPPDMNTPKMVESITKDIAEVRQTRKERESVRERGGYDPDFEDQEIAFLLFDNLLIYNAWQSKYKLTHKLLYTWLREFEKIGVKEDDICSNLGKCPLDKYLEENSKAIGNDYAYVHRFSNY